MAERQIVHRVEDGMDRRQILATTYQMRNFYTQLRDGYFSGLDVFNYLSHHQIARWADRHGGHVLDVCCGRGLLLPLLRYHAKRIESYTGLDIKPANATWLQRRVTTGEPLPDGPDAYYPWPTHFVAGNVAEAGRLVNEQATNGQPVTFDFIVYTAAIEHMHKEDGQASLHQLRALAAPDAQLILTCPNTPEGQDGYDTRYRAHVYEWKLSELRAGLADAGWRVTDTWGLSIGVRELQSLMDAAGTGGMLRRLREHVPPEWLTPIFAPLFPAQADEVGLRATPGNDTPELFA